MVENGLYDMAQKPYSSDVSDTLTCEKCSTPLCWIIRAHELNIINDALCSKLFEAIKENGYKKKEPVDYPGREVPQKMKQMTLHALAEGVISEEEALKLCPDCVSKSKTQRMLPPGRRYTAREFMELSLEERDKLLAESAEQAAQYYATDESLNDFNAYDEVDVIEDYIK